MHCVNNVNIAHKAVKLFERTSSESHGNIFSFLFRQLGDSRFGFCSSFARYYTSVSDKSSLNNSSPASRVIKNLRSEKTSSGAIRSKNTSSVKLLTKMYAVPRVKLNNGLEMPAIGLGTYQSKENEGEIAVKHAIDVGYRHFDTAFFYENETEVGKAIKDKIEEGVVKRSDIFVCTKLWCIHHAPDKVETACKKSLKRLGLDYIDLYLMHLPVGYTYINDETLLPKDSDGKLQLTDVDYLDTYKAMEQLVKNGLVKSIGVSNFNSEQIQRILNNCEIKPVTNQVECHPGLNQKELNNFCQERQIILTAYCPLGRPKLEEKTPDFYYSAKTKAIAEKYHKTTAQIILRYMIDIGTVPIPKSTNKDRIEENFNVFDFKLSADDIVVMDSFNTGKRLVPFLLIKEQNHKYFPFNIKF